MNETIGWNKEIKVGRHFKDVDDLRLNRDGPLDKTENIIEDIDKISEKIIDETKLKNKKIITFISSPKKRTIETTNLIIDRIKEKEPNLKCFIEENELIRELDQGEYVLNDNYGYGDNVRELSLANNVYWDEVSNKRNFDYHFGDPIYNKESDTYQHPEFSEFFTSFGESYKEQSIRLYESIIELYNKRFNLDKVNLVVMTHGGPLVIFNELSNIANEIKNTDWAPEPGSIMNLTWDNYIKKGVDIAHNHGSTTNISIEGIFEEKIIKILKDEILIMKNNQK